LGAVLGALGAAWWTRAKTRIIVSALIGSALGIVGGSLVVAVIEPAYGSSQMGATLAGMIAAATAGALLGTSIWAFSGTPRKAAVGVSIGALAGVLGGTALTLCTTFGMHRLFTLSLCGGLAGAALGTLIAVRRAEAWKRALRSALIGGRLGLAGGTILLALL